MKFSLFARDFFVFLLFLALRSQISRFLLHLLFAYFYFNLLNFETKILVTSYIPFFIMLILELVIDVRIFSAKKLFRSPPGLAKLALLFFCIGTSYLFKAFYIDRETEIVTIQR